MSFVLLACALWLLAFRVRYEDLVSRFANLSPAQELVLRNFGVSGTIHAGLVFAIEYLAIMAFVGVAIFIYLRRSDDWVAIFITASLVGYIAWTSPPLDALLNMGSAWMVLSKLVQAIGFILAGAIFLYFPSGRLYPRWAGLLWPVLIFAGAASVILPARVFDLTNPFQSGLASFVLLIVVRLTGFGSQVYRYFTISTPVQRQQTKWILFSVSLAVLAYITFGIDRFVLPALSEPVRAGVVYDLVGVPIFLLATIPIPVAFAYAILRHRLWDIDAIISRTLVYAALTAILAGLYTASITLTQRAFVAVTGERSAAAIALTTLAIGASATPIRAWLQSIVDRYVKQRPDPTRGLLAFAGEVDSILEVLDCRSFLSRSLDETVTAFGATGGALCFQGGPDTMPYRTSGNWSGVCVIEASAEYAEGQAIRIALGPRRGERAYLPRDVEVLGDTVRAVADTIRTVGDARFPVPHFQIDRMETVSGRSN